MPAPRSVTVAFGPMAVRQRRRRRRWHRWVAMAASTALLVYLQLCLHARLQAATDGQSAPPAASGQSALPVPNATAAPQAMSEAAAGDSAAGRIPMLVHQSWKDDGFPKDMFNFRWQEQILALNPGWRLMKSTGRSQTVRAPLPTASTVGTPEAMRRRSGRGVGPSQLPSPARGRGARLGGSIRPGGLSPFGRCGRCAHCLCSRPSAAPSPSHHSGVTPPIIVVRPLFVLQALCRSLHLPS